MNNQRLILLIRIILSIVLLVGVLIATGTLSKVANGMEKDDWVVFIPIGIALIPAILLTVRKFRNTKTIVTYKKEEDVDKSKHTDELP